MSYTRILISRFDFYANNGCRERAFLFLMFLILSSVGITQIGIKAEWRGHHGRLVLFLGNKSTNPLTSVQALILPPAHLKLELSPVPDTIPPRAQVLHSVDFVNFTTQSHTLLFSVTLCLLSVPISVVVIGTIST